MRTKDEIVQRLVQLTEVGKDFFGFQSSDLLAYLDLEQAKRFLKHAVSEAEWRAVEAERKPPRDAMLGYLEFAWGKAIDNRGLSAARSIEHYKAWAWLDGADELLAELERPYECYGKDHLVKVCQYLGVDHNKWDDGVRTNG